MKPCGASKLWRKPPFIERSIQAQNIDLRVSINYYWSPRHDDVDMISKYLSTDSAIFAFIIKLPNSQIRNKLSRELTRIVINLVFHLLWTLTFKKDHRVRLIKIFPSQRWKVFHSWLFNEVYETLQYPSEFSDVVSAIMQEEDWQPPVQFKKGYVYIKDILIKHK